MPMMIYSSMAWLVFLTDKDNGNPKDESSQLILQPLNVDDTPLSNDTGLITPENNQGNIQRSIQEIGQVSDPEQNTPSIDEIENQIEFDDTAGIVMI